MIPGIGVGLYTYVDFLVALARGDGGPSTSEIGIIVAELMPISARICPAALTAAEMRDEIRNILDAHGWTKLY